MSGVHRNRIVSRQRIIQLISAALLNGYAAGFQKGKIFTGGIYSNKKSGMVDVHGINYYSQEQTCLMMEKIIEMKPSDYQILLKWMEEVKEYIGFYVLGL